MASEALVSPAVKVEPPQEYDDLQDLLSQIPKKAQKGLLMQMDLKLTCIDANEDYIALGSNIGITFLFDRKKRTVERIRSKSTSDTISVVKLHKGLEDQLAMATNGGVLYIFQLPSDMPGKNKKLQQFIVQGIHKSSVVCLCWSVNGMKLFSGDKKGTVACSEVDFMQNECKCNVMHVEDSEIVQLDYIHKILLVSSLYQSFVLKEDKNTWTIGQKERKSLGRFGAVFIPEICKMEDTKLYAARPGLRIWKSSVNGVVLNTFLYKEVLSQTHHQIRILPFEGQTHTLLKDTELQFGPLLLFNENCLVSWTEHYLFLLDPRDASVVGSQQRIGVIVDVATTESEIFVLRKNTNRNVIRLGYKELEKQVTLFEKLSKEREMATAFLEEKKDAEKGKLSPLNFLQKNIVEKIKNIDISPSGPSAKTLNISGLPTVGDASDHCKDEVDAGVGLEFTSGETVEDLPPVVKLNDSDLDLLALDLLTGVPTGADAIEKYQESKKTLDSQVKTPTQERINPFLKDQHLFDAGGSTSETENTSAVKKPLFLSEKLENISLESDEIVFSRKGKKKNKKKAMDKKMEEVQREDSDSDKSDISRQKSSSSLEGSKVGIIIEDRLLAPKSKELSRSMESLHGKSEKDLKENKQNESQVTIAKNRAGSGTESSKHFFKMEPENERKFQEIAANLADFENTLTDIPPANYIEQYQQSLSHKMEDGDIKAASFYLDAEEKNDTSESSNLNKPLSKADSDFFEVMTSEEEKIKSDSGNLPTSQIPSSETPGSSSLPDEYVINVVKGQEEALDAGKGFSDTYDPLSYKTDQTEADSQITNISNASDSTRQACLDNYIPKDGMHGRGSLPNLEQEDSIYAVKSPKNLVIQPSLPMEEDIYSMYSGGEHPTSPSAEVKSSPLTLDSEELSPVHVLDDTETPPEKRFINNWTEISTSANIADLSLSVNHLWVVEKSGIIVYANLRAASIKWVKVLNAPSKQISVSPSGDIVWRLHRDKVYAGTKITPKRPEGMKWVEALREVQQIAVDDSSAWYIKNDGEIMMQKGLSKDRPCYKSVKVPDGDYHYEIKMIICRQGVVWALTNDLKLLHRNGITADCPEGSSWEIMNAETQQGCLLFSCITLGEGGVGWGVDVMGRTWFVTNVSRDQPMGSGIWWEVPVSEIVIQDPTMYDAIKLFAKNLDPQKLTYILSAQKQSLIVAGEGGIWVCPDMKTTLRVCRSCIEGYRWREISMPGFTSSITWKSIIATASEHKHGLLWCTQPNGDLYTYSSIKNKVKTLERPSRNKNVLSLSVCEDAVWALTEDNAVYIRKGIAAHCPQGAEWVKLDLAQLDGADIISLTCSSHSVWALDSKGQVYNRIGVKAPSTYSLTQAWLPVESNGSFMQIISGPQDWMVWAIDNRRQVYVRIGITDNMPIGTDWRHVPGTSSIQLSASKNHIWALNFDHEILCRYGITKLNPEGDYWKKMPGIFNFISASPSDVLWAISQEGLTHIRETKLLIRRQISNDTLLSRIRRDSSLEDWELL